ncbi:hypothetical protein HDU76_010025 [Blyttiomyces sp. JEL0837]|nr:hypothetical protein HDU76_010025 [Blyttiomyces sp. JEL0837]
MRFSSSVRFFFLVIIALLGCSLFAASTVSAAAASDSLTYKKYIVVFKDSAAQSALTEVSKKIEGWGGKISRVFKIINAIAADIPTKFISTLEALPVVDYIEEDQQVNALKAGDDDAMAL